MNFRSIVGKYPLPEIPLLVFASLLAGCANKPGPPVDLPVAVNAMAAPEHGRNTLVITCTADRTMWLGSKIASHEVLTNRLNDLRKKYDPISTVIRADRHMRIADLLALHDVYRIRPQDRCAITVTSQDPAIVREIPFTSYLRGRCEDFGPMIRIEYTSNGLSFNRRHLTGERVNERLMQLAGADKGIPIMVVAKPNDTLQDAVNIMNMCHKAGLAKIFLVDRELY